MVSQTDLGLMNHSIKAKRAPGFRQPQLFHKAMAIFESQHIRLPLLRFVIDLFDKQVMRDIVLDEDEDQDLDATIQPE